MKKFLLIACTYFCVNLFAQHYQTVVDVNDNCASLLGFSSNEEAEKAVDNILNQVGLFRNFIIQECPNINNAIAVNVQDDRGETQRYILYDAAFFKKIGRGNDYAALFILAHEIGHHLNGHALSKKGSTPQFELEADYFAGKVMGEMGYTLEQTLMALNGLTYEHATATHPAKADRIAQATLGFNHSKKRPVVPSDTIPIKAKIEIENAEKEFKSKNYEQTLIHIRKAEVHLTNWIPRLGYMKIISLASRKEYINSELQDEIKIYMKYAEDFPNEINMDQYKEVYAIEDKVNEAIKDAKWRNDPMYGQGTMKILVGKFLEAEHYFKIAADQGNPYAEYYLGLMYLNGRGVTKDYAKAHQFISKSVSKGNVFAMTELAYMYQNGFHVSKDANEALKWYKKAAAENDSKAINNLGWMYYEGDGVYQDFSEAKYWFEKAASKDFENSLYGLGLLYENGKGVTKDYYKAFDYYLKAAQKDHFVAVNQIGYLFENGLGTPKNYEAAFNWYSKGVNLGNGTSMNNLGWMYVNGNYVKQDYKKALELFQKAANLNNHFGQYALGYMYENGLGTKKNIETAVGWYQKSARLGNSTAQSRLRSLGYSW